ncbi:hypothetical protein HHK36_028243 [Tetracentron sinense]|uniref:RNA helicase n=1 Tax=Tetracentron sinense TaxID=13715 RepID=A0A834YEI8_TETSI|nr:hypothetical protein HHK36_028243 [Tetracentron sinense]
MGRKLNEAALLSKSETLGIADNHGGKAEKKKKKQKKNKDSKQFDLVEENQTPELLENLEGEAKRKRKLGETELVLQEENGTLEVSENNGSDTEKKKKKKKKKAKEVTLCEELELDNGKGSKTLKVTDKEDKKQKESGGFENGERKRSIDEDKQEKIARRDELDGVVVSGKNTTESKYAALSSFVESQLPDELLECCKNFSKPSPIQSYAWPFLLDGRDLIGIAKTGSGKTLAFGVPALMHIMGKKKNKTSKRANPLCLVLSPTRELAQQIADVLCDAGKPCGVKSICLYGGTSKGPQISSLKSGVTAELKCQYCSCSTILKFGDFSGDIAMSSPGHKVEDYNKATEWTSVSRRGDWSDGVSRETSPKEVHPRIFADQLPTGITSITLTHLRSISVHGARCCVHPKSLVHLKGVQMIESDDSQASSDQRYLSLQLISLPLVRKAVEDLYCGQESLLPPPSFEQDAILLHFYKGWFIASEEGEWE